MNERISVSVTLVGTALLAGVVTGLHRLQLPLSELISVQKSLDIPRPQHTLTSCASAHAHM